MTSAWSVLGIGPTGDIAAVRRAYAAKLKITRPEDDADAFQALVEARDRCLAEARHWRAPPQRAEPVAPPPLVPRPDRLPSAGALRRLRKRYLAALHAGRPAEELAPLRRELTEACAAATARRPRSARQRPPQPDRRAAMRGGAPLDTAVPPEPQALWDGSRFVDPHEQQQAGRLLEELVASLPGGTADRARWPALAQGFASLSAGGRRHVEADLVRRLWQELCPISGAIDPAALCRLAPLLVLLEPAFDWARDDRVAAAALAPADAAAFLGVARRASLGASPARRAEVLGEGAARLPFLDLADLHAALSGYPVRLQAIRHAMQRGGFAPRFEWRAAPVPVLWLFRHHLPLTAIVVAVLQAALFVQLGRVTSDLEAGLSIAGVALVGLVVAFNVDRLCFRDVRRGVRKADARGLVRPRQRAEFLAHWTSPANSWTIRAIDILASTSGWWLVFIAIKVAVLIFAR